MPNELKLCPFCNGDAILRKHKRHHYKDTYEVAHIVCSKCHCSTVTRIIDGYCGATDTIQDVINDWNRRVDNAD